MCSWNGAQSYVGDLLYSFAIHKMTNLKGKFLGRLSPYSDVCMSHDVIDSSSQRENI